MKKLFFIVALTNALIIHTRHLEDVYIELAHAWQQEGNSSQTLATCTQLLQLNPHHQEAHLLAGIEYYKQGALLRALEHFNARLALNPSCAMTHLYAGMAHAVNNNLDAAIKHYTQSLSYNADQLKTYAVYGIALEKKGSFEQAMNIYQQALTREPNNTELRIRLAYVYKILAHNEKALHEIELLLQEFPAKISLLEEKAEILVQLKNYTQAIDIYESQAQAAAQNPVWLAKLAQLYTVTKSYDKAIQIYEKLISQSHQPHIHYELANLYLAQNRMTKGFFHLHSSNLPGAYPEKLLIQTHNIAGNAILVDGGGAQEDILLFLPYLHHLKKSGAFVILKAPQEVKSLLEQCQYIDQVTCNNQIFFDWYIPITSLPYLFKNDFVENSSAYLNAHPALFDTWHTSLAHVNRKNIGIYIKNSAVRVDSIISALPKDTDVYILWCDNYEFLQNLPSTKKYHCFGKGFDESNEDLTNLAAIMKSMDLVITSNCTAAHLAGALGCTTLVMLDDATLSWRWQHVGGASVWYPTVYILKEEIIDQLSMIIDSFYSEKIMK